MPTENFAINGAFSFLNKNEFELEGVAGGVIPLNAARFRGALGLDYTLPKCGFGFSTNWRWSEAFPANSAIYQGTVVAQNLLDLGIRYTPTWAENTTLTLDMTNVLGTDLQRFPGTPEIGRVTMLRFLRKKQTLKLIVLSCLTLSILRDLHINRPVPGKVGFYLARDG